MSQMVATARTSEWKVACAATLQQDWRARQPLRAASAKPAPICHAVVPLCLQARSRHSERRRPAQQRATRARLRRGAWSGGTVGRWDGGREAYLP